MSATDDFKPTEGISSEGRSGADTRDNDYKSRPGQNAYGVPVVGDNKAVPSGLEGDQDTDEQLKKDDIDAIDTDNIIDEKTRGAKPQGGYKEPGDEEGLERLE